MFKYTVIILVLIAYALASDLDNDAFIKKVKDCQESQKKGGNDCRWGCIYKIKGLINESDFTFKATEAIEEMKKFYWNNAIRIPGIVEKCKEKEGSQTSLCASGDSMHMCLHDSLANEGIVPPPHSQ